MGQILVHFDSLSHLSRMVMVLQRTFHCDALEDFLQRGASTAASTNTYHLQCALSRLLLVNMDIAQQTKRWQSMRLLSTWAGSGSNGRVWVEQNALTLVPAPPPPPKVQGREANRRRRRLTEPTTKALSPPPPRDNFPKPKKQHLAEDFACVVVSGVFDMSVILQIHLGK